MSNVIKGTFSLQEMLVLTWDPYHRNRYEYMKRDVIKKIAKIKQTELHPDRKHEPNITYVFLSKSFPNYGNYLKHTDRPTQRKYHHEYDNILSFATDENGQFSMQSKDWKYRLGSEKRWKFDPPQNSIKTIYKATMQEWQLDYKREKDKIKRSGSRPDMKTRKLKKAKNDFEKRIKRHKQSAKYVDVGDYNARVNGLNGDAVFRVHPVLEHYGHLYGKNTEETDKPDYMHPFLPKHALNLINALIKLKLLV